MPRPDSPAPDSPAALGPAALGPGLLAALLAAWAFTVLAVVGGDELRAYDDGLADLDSVAFTAALLVQAAATLIVVTLLARATPAGVRPWRIGAIGALLLPVMLGIPESLRLLARASRGEAARDAKYVGTEDWVVIGLLVAVTALIFWCRSAARRRYATANAATLGVIVLGLAFSVVARHLFRIAPDTGNDGVSIAWVPFVALPLWLVLAALICHAATAWLDGRRRAPRPR
ncbi:MAG: hypothetical protein QM809_07625 [Gordonia sp. (in: high G+C Gram-positive bacteria)]|uniref:hypothetical protein n=1 Tax=Gordonia sp. (in: high G+C Gram-positive bacteria) TaxID=84139 RepID=UPI0039E2D939